MQLSKRLDSVIESQTLAMTKLARSLKEKGKDIISLSIGEPDFDTPLNICTEATNAMSRGETHYTPVMGTLAFRKAIQEKLKRDNNLSYTTDEIIVSNGAKQSIFNAVMALVDPGDEVLLPAPFWVSYPAMVNYAGGVCVEIPTSIETNYKVSAETLESYITPKTKLIIFSSPCNPSGSVMSEMEIKAWAEVLERHPQVFVISDEIYEKIVYNTKPFSIASIPAMKNRVATVNGLAKGYAMTGWRIGYMAGPEALIKACEKFQGLISSGANSIAQAAGIEALIGDQSRVEEMRQQFEKRKALMAEKLAGIPGLKVNNPEGAFYHFPDVSAFIGKSHENGTINNADELCMYLLETAWVALVSGDAFGAENCIRLSYATSEQQIVEAVSRIHKALMQLK
jgi:aspartate aminotransferase